MGPVIEFPPLLVCFAFDIDRGATKSGFIPAKQHLGSDFPNPMYGQARLEGYAAAHRITHSRMLFPGKDERRFKGEVIDIDGTPSPLWQGFIIRKMLVEDYGCNPARIDWLRSTGTTGNAADAVRVYLEQQGIVAKEGVVEFSTSFYHCNRAGRVALRHAGLPCLLTPAESFTVAEAILHGTQNEAEERLRSFGGHLADIRIINEIRGIALDLLDMYEPQTKNW